jgi:hypothetical protein
MAGMDDIEVKSKDEIVAQLAEIIHRHRRRYLRKYTRPCPINCVYATESNKKGVTGCKQCDSFNPEQCRVESAFVSISTKDEVIEQFRQDLRDPNILRHEYRDVMTLLWVLNSLNDSTLDLDKLDHQGGRRRADQ